MKKRWFSGLKLNTKFTMVILVFVILPISILMGILFANMEQNVIKENVNYMQYTMERNQDNIETNIDSVNMTTQFFLSDEQLSEVLNKAVLGEKLTTKELIDFDDGDIASLERLVNNNPLLYGVRVYAMNDNVQELMPILYKNSRMQRLAWSRRENYSGWIYGYRDTLFVTKENEQNARIVSLVTPISDYNNGTIGIVEAAMTMQSMFPTLYEDIENEWSCFIADDGVIYFGDNEREDSRSFAKNEIKDGIKKEGINTYYTHNGQSGSSCVVSYMYIRELGGTLLSVQDISPNINHVYRLRAVSITVVLFLAIGLAFLINGIVKHLLGQFYDILKSIRKVQNGDLNVRIERCGNDEMGELGLQINKMLNHIEQLMQDNINREVLAKNSQIRALQNQINAHFIYNVLESIKMMAEIDEEYAISDAITSLGKLLRYSMKWVSGNVVVDQELEYIKNYLALINLRFDYEIILSVNMPDIIRRQQIPKMSLQPIVENAIYHGIEQMAEDTNIYIKGIVEGENYVIEITDAGKGMSEEEVHALERKISGEIETSGGSGNGIGLKNVQDRIVMAFGRGYGISIAAKIGCYTKIRVKLPLEKKAK